MSCRSSFVHALRVAAVAACAACSTAETFAVEERGAGERAPNTAVCDDIDPTRCLLPWPTSRALVADDTTATGVRVRLDPAALLPDDDPSAIELADGFSCVSPLAVGFGGALDPGSVEGSVLLFNAEPGSPRYGEAVPLRMRLVTADDASLLMAFPRRPMEANAEHVAVVVDTVTGDDGARQAASRATTVLLGLEAPTSQAEADLAGYHAPLRALLAEQSIAPTSVLKAWSFVTRSQANATRRLRTMADAALQAARAGDLHVTIDEVTAGEGDVAAVVVGRLGGLPSYLDGLRLVFDDDELPRVVGKREAPFRVLVPAGEGDYRFVMYGHGLGGNFRDAAFDGPIAATGAGKVGIQFHGWSDEDMVETLLALSRGIPGAHQASVQLMQALADASAIQEALEPGGVLAEALAAPTLGGAENPASGRRPDGSVPVWAGGSLGGTAGMTFAILQPSIQHAVLNVPGAAWTHFVTESVFFGSLEALATLRFGDNIDVMQVLSMAQTVLDDVDGAVWAAEAEDEVFLIQQSVGDPVLPRAGSEMVAVATGARFVGAPISPILDLPVEAGAALEQTAITQFRTYEQEPLEVHGFADRDTPAGDAAREQIRHFITSLWQGEAEIVVPPTCVANGGSCDFEGEAP